MWRETSWNLVDAPALHYDTRLTSIAGISDAVACGWGVLVAYFEYEFKKVSTGRRSKRNRYAVDEAGLRAALAHDQQVGEVFSVRLGEAIPASDAQLDYLRDLIGRLPKAGLSMLEASDLITNAKDLRHPADERDRRLAERFGADFTNYSSRAAIFDRITSKWIDEVHLARWFVYRVYRDGFDRGAVDGVDDPDHEVLAGIAAEMVSSRDLWLSLYDAAGASFCGFRWFGALPTPEGVHIIGDHEGEAYEFVASRLDVMGLISRASRQARRQKGDFVKEDLPDGRALDGQAQVVSSKPHSGSTLVGAIIFLGGLLAMLLIMRALL